MAQKKLIVANWKMNPAGFREAESLFKSVVKKVGRVKNTRVVLCPPNLYLGELAGGYGGTAVLFGAQDVFWADGTGAHTGETSARMLKEAGVEYVIVGHSERRALGEVSVLVAKKVKTALDARLIPILCVGEAERDGNGEYLRFLEDQILASLAGVSRKAVVRAVVAYEPVWAIGKQAGDAVSPEVLQETILFIKKVLIKKFGMKAGSAVKILYGGSVEAVNAGELYRTGVIDGFLVGHASLDADEFVEIVKAV